MADRAGDQGYRDRRLQLVDSNFEATTREFRETGDGKLLWEAHFSGIEGNYCQIEKLANLG